MQNLIIASITFLFGVAFLLWGIYQIKTGKMIAKRARNTVDEPKQVGALFIFVSLIGFWIAYMFLMTFLSIEPISIVSIAFMAIEVSFVAATAIYGLINKRIFGFKKTPKVNKLVKKYYAAVNIAMLAVVASIVMLFSNMVALNANTIVFVILISVIFLGVLVAIPLMAKIEHDSKK